MSGTRNKWQGMRAESKHAGLNLINTQYQGMSALELRSVDPALADKWAVFIGANMASIVSELSKKIV